MEKKRERNILIKGAVILLKFPIIIYQKVISPLTPASCRFAPTCSQYAMEAITIWGPIKGVWLTIKRLSKCHPWGDCGYDPVPPKR